MQIGVFNTDTEFTSCWLPTWPRVGLQHPGKSWSGGRLGVFWALLGASRRFCSASREFWDRCRRFWKGFGLGRGRRWGRWGRPGNFQPPPAVKLRTHPPLHTSLARFTTTLTLRVTTPSSRTYRKTVFGKLTRRRAADFLFVKN